ncbi:DUF3800 domain-containing protein [Streptomyces sp. NPDC003077]|uniref:DUF3800 domain-containing protein n=1 Tax=Streptomyces sp. NPDC003077 TaxID=3154443 RepID=UPI0033A2CD1E
MSAAPASGARVVQPPRLHVYVDETGDRGFQEKSSTFFAMTALMVPAEDDWNVRVTAGGLRALIHRSRPETTAPLHWVEHFKRKHAQRRNHAARQLALMPSAKVSHVIVPKTAVRFYEGLADGVRFYNYTTRLLLERVAYAAERWEGGPRLAVVRLGAVRGMDHGDTADYLDEVRRGGAGDPDVPWRAVKWPPVWTGTDWDGIQFADLHAGLLNVALSGVPDDDDCAANLLLCKHQLHRSRPGALLGYGVKILGDPSFVTERCWWHKWNVP